jgi:predicted GH43/DUF377 family glycosyl hydrolase
MKSDGLLHRLETELQPDTMRRVLRPFTPAEDPRPGTASPTTHWTRVVERVLGMDGPQAAVLLRSLTMRLATRHRDVERIFERRYLELTDPTVERTVTPEQARLIGAYFTEEYSFEAVALFNPSIVPHPDQSGVPAGSLRFVMSLRGVGEGHISSIIFRTGLFSATGEMVLDPPDPQAISPRIDYIPGGAPDDPGVRLSCGGGDGLSEIVIFPVTFHQRHGLEDLRLVRFVDDDGSVTYFGTYTALGGDAIRQELLRTTDFRTFDLSAMRGVSSITKGMALFPRRIDGRYAMLGRQDHENIWLLRSNDLYSWDDGAMILSPRWPWEFVQLGNGGSPIEIDEGWLVILHGVGALRNYCLGACLLDKADPSKVLARLSRPLVVPDPEAHAGYVPSVVYSCGALVCGRTLLLPYGVADSFTAFATISIDRLLAAMQ